MNRNSSDYEDRQMAFCLVRGVAYVASLGTSKTGFALSTRGQLPMNGLRHPPQTDTSGWYLWCGENFSESPDFFQPIHTNHIYEEYPDAVKLFGLPPGYRFLMAEGYLDIWYDSSLLNV